MTKKPKKLEAWQAERDVEKFVEVAEAKRATRTARTALAEKEREAAELATRIAKFEHPSLHSVVRLLESRPTLTRRQIAKALKVDPSVADEVLVDMEAAGYNVHNGTVSKQGGGKAPEVEHFYGPVVRFGALADAHLGNVHAMEHELGEAYEVFRREGINNVYACGNLLDGEKAYRGQEYEIKVMGADNVVAYAARVWPKVDGITTHHIASSTCHEGYYLKSAGLLIGKMLERERPDMKYLGLDEANVALMDCPARPTLRLMHPGGGSSYADSYRPQKIVESFGGGEKPTVLLIGHYHKSLQDDIRDVATFQVGCLETQTPFMRKHSIRAVLGFWIVDLRLTDDGSLRRIRGEFFRYYMGRDGQVIRRWTTT
jgi:hypothetical protein